MKKRAFVSGATGFTGGHLALRLVYDGWLVRVLVRSTSSYSELKKAGCEIVIGDITDSTTYTDALKGVNTVFHIAAYYRSEGTKEEFWAVHVKGTEELLNAAVSNQVTRFIHCSTVGVHGEVDCPPADENAPFKPGDLYQKTKLEGENIALDYFKKGKIKGAIFRPVGIYGPGDRRFLKLFKIVNSPVTAVFGKGNKLYHLTYIDDLIDGIMLLAEHDNVTNDIFILAGPEYTTLKELFEKIAHVLHKKLRLVHIPLCMIYVAAYMNEWIAKVLRIKPLLYRRRLDFFSKDRAFTSKKAQHILGYNPKVSLEQGLAKTVDWYKEKKLL